MKFEKFHPNDVLGRPQETCWNYRLTRDDGLVFTWHRRSNRWNLLVTLDDVTLECSWKMKRELIGSSLDVERENMEKVSKAKILDGALRLAQDRVVECVNYLTKAQGRLASQRDQLRKIEEFCEAESK